MLEVIGIGFPRTGTMSLKHALEQLSLGPCYHMIEVFRRPLDVPFWRKAIQSHGEGVAWEEVFADFRSTTDCPAGFFWKQLLAEFPQSHYVLTVRDPDDWYESFLATVYDAMTHPERAPDDDHLSVQLMARELILDRMFDGRFLDRDFAISQYHSHIASVQAAIPPEHLLTFDVASGWEPLCAFLQLPVPDQPFPRSNTRDEFRERITSASVRNAPTS